MTVLCTRPSSFATTTPLPQGHWPKQSTKSSALAHELKKPSPINPRQPSTGVGQSQGTRGIQGPNVKSLCKISQFILLQDPDMNQFPLRWPQIFRKHDCYSYSSQDLCKAGFCSWIFAVVVVVFLVFLFFFFNGDTCN